MGVPTWHVFARGSGTTYRQRLMGVCTSDGDSTYNVEEHGVMKTQCGRAWSDDETHLQCGRAWSDVDTYNVEEHGVMKTLTMWKSME